jgi:hypothetical protein
MASGLPSKPEERPTDKETLPGEAQPETNHFEAATTTEYSEKHAKGT